MLTDAMTRFLFWPWSDEVINGILIKNGRRPMEPKSGFSMTSGELANVAGCRPPMLLDKVYGDFRYDNDDKPSPIMGIMPIYAYREKSL